MTKDNVKWLEAADPRTLAAWTGISRSEEEEHGEPIFTWSSFEL